MRKQCPEKNFFQLYYTIIWGNVRVNKSSTASRYLTRSMFLEGPQRISTVKTHSVSCGDELFQITEKIDAGLSEDDQMEEISTFSIEPETSSQEMNRIEI